MPCFSLLCISWPNQPIKQIIFLSHVSMYLAATSTNQACRISPSCASRGHIHPTSRSYVSSTSHFTLVCITSPYPLTKHVIFLLHAYLVTTLTHQACRISPSCVSRGNVHSSSMSYFSLMCILLPQSSTHEACRISPSCVHVSRGDILP